MSNTFGSTILSQNDRHFSMMGRTLGEEAKSRPLVGTLNPPRQTNRIDDIDGARTMNTVGEKFGGKLPNSYDVSDIPGTKPKRSMMSAAEQRRNAPDFTLKVDDIEGAQPRRAEFITTRCVNPLNPAYALPTCKVIPPPEPKFLRDSYDVSDIPGTKSTLGRSSRFHPRDSHSVDDIIGAQAGWRPRHEMARRVAAPHDIMKTSDVLGDKFKSTRVTDPLDPVYHVNYVTIADDPSSKPRKLPTGKNVPFYSLYVDDIEGTKAGWKPSNVLNPPIEQRRDFKRTNALDDIQGAQANTVRHTIQTQRVTNPLEPDYVGLDGQPLEPVIPQYTSIVTMKRTLDGPAVPQQGDVSHRSTGGKNAGMMFGEMTTSIFGQTQAAPPSSRGGEKDRKIQQLERQLAAALAISQHSARGHNDVPSSTSSRPPLDPSSSSSSSSRLMLDLSRTQQSQPSQSQGPSSRQGSAPGTPLSASQHMNLSASSSSRLIAAGGSATSQSSSRAAERERRSREAEVQSVRELY